MPIIQVLIFRGTGGVYNTDHPHFNKPALVCAGHVGVMGVIDDKIIGFHPTPEATDKAGGEKALLEALQQQQPHAGRLQDDNDYFERAYALIEATDGRTTVYTYEVEISEDTLAQIRSWYTEGKEALYNFPDDDGEFNMGESNCALFWSRFGVDMPVKTRNIKELTRYMKIMRYQKWSND